MWFRIPVKLFRPTRVDYMIIPRAINPRILKGDPWSWRTSGPIVLLDACRKHGIGFIPNYVLPPFLANSIIGVVLYTTYIESLQLMHPPSHDDPHRAIPPPPVSVTWRAGVYAGLAQAMVSQPIDALTVRFQVSEMLEDKYRNMWQYAWRTLREVGLKPIFGGFMLSAAKESLSMGAFFATFEFIKNQCYYTTLGILYGRERLSIYKDNPKQDIGIQQEQPFWLLGPAFLLTAGLGASVAHTSMHYPLSRIQEVHLARLEKKDYRDRYERRFARSRAFSIYFSEYWQTAKECSSQAAAAGGWRQFCFKGFLATAIRGAPATSVGLIIFESFRSHFSGGTGADVFLAS